MEEGETNEVLPAPDHNHGPHAHGTGVRWLDVIVTVSVVFLSILSLAVSIEHGKTMERMVDQNQKMVEASTLPILTIKGAQLDPDTAKPSPREALVNDGVGPAVIDRFEVRYKGIAYASSAALLHACCESALSKGTWHSAYYSNVSGYTLSARGDIRFITIGSDADPKLLKAFENARDDLTFHACYCSVLDECWETDFDRKRPQPVNSCRVSPNEKLW